MKRVLVIFLSVLTITVFPQPLRKHPPAENRILTDHKIIRSDSSVVLVYSFALRNDMLVFTKENGAYKAEYKIEVELVSEINSQIERFNYYDIMKVSSYSETISEAYREGLIKIPLKMNRFGAKPLFTDIYSHNEIKLPEFRYNTDSTKNVFFLIKDGNNGNMKGEWDYLNRGRYIPLSSKPVHLIIPDNKATKGPFTAYAFSRNDTSTLQLEEFYDEGIDIDSTSNGLRLKAYKSIGSHILLVKSINEKLPEGECTIRISSGQDTNFFRSQFRVFWFNKPQTLMNPEFASKLIIIMDTEDKADSIKRAVDEDDAGPLFQYWKKYDPTPITVFNELMAEFYFRADEANNRYSTIRGNDGVLTDRGKIFVKYGEPTKIDRGSSPIGKMSEIWYYASINKSFRFVDRTGAGNYELQ